MWVLGEVDRDDWICTRYFIWTFSESIIDYFFSPHFHENEIFISKSNYGKILHIKCKQLEWDIIANFIFEFTRLICADLFR